MYDIITFGSASKDIMVRPKKLSVLKYKKGMNGEGEICFPLGSKVDIESIAFNSGGGGTNTAATFAKQGFKAAFCGVVGTDVAGQMIIKELKSLKVNTALLFKNKTKPTNHSIVIEEEGQDRTILVFRGASELLDKKDIPWRKLKTKWLYLAPLTGLLCLPAGRQTTTPFEDIVDFAVDQKIKIAINPSMAQLSLGNFSEILKKIDVLLLNQEEASFLTKTPFQQEKEIFKKLDEMCPGIAVMTKGAEGVVVSDGETIYSAQPSPTRVVADTIGAGDSFGSGFVSEYMRTADIEKAIQLGMANSQGCLSEVGAKNGLLKKGEVFEKVKVGKEIIK